MGKFEVIESIDGLVLVYLDGQYLIQFDEESDFLMFLDKFIEKSPTQKIFKRTFVDSELYDIPIPYQIKELQKIIENV